MTGGLNCVDNKAGRNFEAMGLPHRRHKMNLGMPDYLGIILLVGCIAMAIVSYSELAQMNWTRTTATVIGVSAKQSNTSVNSSQLDYSTSGVTVQYRYDTGTQILTGSGE